MTATILSAELTNGSKTRPATLTICEIALEAIDGLLSRYSAAYQAVETVLQDYTR